MLLYRKQLSACDTPRLAETLDHAADTFGYAADFDALRTMLRRGEILPREDVPEDMITMNSRFILSEHVTDQRRVYALVYPEHEAAWHGKISVLSAMGRALLGARVGEDVCWLTRDGPVLMRVESILYQPEAAGKAPAQPAPQQ